MFETWLSSADVLYITGDLHKVILYTFANS